MFGHMGGIGFGFGGILSLIIVVLLVWFLIRAFNRGEGSEFLSKKEKKDPLEILRERYAKGEIDDEEFEKRKKMLKDS